MDDFSLVPVDHQPEFDDFSLVPVDYDPFSADGTTQQAQTQTSTAGLAQPGVGTPASNVEAATSGESYDPNSPSGVSGSGQPNNSPAAPISPPGTLALVNQQQPGGSGLASGGDSSSFGKSLLQGAINAVPGAYYSGLAQQQFRQGNYGAAALYGAESLVDAALGVATLGASTRWGAAARAVETLVPAAADTINLHHAWPKYLGGAVKQDLVSLPKSLHDEFHKGLDEYLPRRFGTAYYESLGPTEKQQAFQHLATYTKNFDAEYGTKLYDALHKNGFPAR